MRITFEGQVLAAHFPWDPVLVGKAQGIPDRKWNKKDKRWEFKPSLNAMEYVRKVFPEATWDEGATHLYNRTLARQAARAKVADGYVPEDDLAEVPFAKPPFDHQKTALLLGRNQESFAYLMEMGTGKTKVLLDDAAHNFRHGRIDAILVICPNSVKTNWVNCDGVDQVSTHLAPDIPSLKAAWYSKPVGQQLEDWREFRNSYKDKDTLLILAVNIEAIFLPRVMKDLWDFCCARKVMIVIDESTRIKNRNAKRSKSCQTLRKRCILARILSGTPLVKSPLDAFSQFWFLDPNIIGYGSFMTFQSRYAIMGGWKGKQAMAYQNLDELSSKIAGCSYRVTKDQCLDLPEKLYERRRVKMTELQRQHYRNLAEQAITFLDSQHQVFAQDVLVRLLRLQQVTSGYLPIIDDITGEVKGIHRIEPVSPKIQEALEIIEDTDTKVVVWCRFIEEIREMQEQLEKAGIGHVVFYGDVSEKDRAAARRDFQERKEVRVFIGQIRTGGIGIDLYAGNTCIYLSNTFSTEDRLQSEDRLHRIGQRNPVEYIDLVCPGTIDLKVIEVLRSNKRLADEIMRDGYKDWI